MIKATKYTETCSGIYKNKINSGVNLKKKIENKKKIFLKHF